MRQGNVGEARGVLDVFVPLARRADAALFTLPLFALDADVEVARGDTAAARRAAHVAVEASLRTSATALWYRPLLAAARAGAVEDLERLLPRAREGARFPILRARVAEVEAIVAGEPARFRTARDLYATLGFPFDEARCLVAAGDRDAATAAVGRFGFSRSVLEPAGLTLLS